MQQQQQSHIYEGMYILNAVLSDEDRNRVLDKITTGISNQGGLILKTFDQGRRELAYEIDKRREGHYFIFYFKAPSKAISQLWKEATLQEEVLRFMTLKSHYKETEIPQKIEFKVLPE
jgi:small subunit ribosomal protein S6